MGITEKRLQRIESVARKRQPDLTVVLENVHDTHNIGAVMRTCDSVGIGEIFVLHNRPDLVKKALVIGKRSSSGTRKWVDVHFYRDTAACFKAVRTKYETVLGTHLDAQARSLYELDLSGSLALVFGNEHEGITSETLAFLDGNFIIPQAGMVKSLNISVACAVTVYEAYRQRWEKGKYADSGDSEFIEMTRQEYIRRHESAYKGRKHQKKE